MKRTLALLVLLIAPLVVAAQAPIVPQPLPPEAGPTQPQQTPPEASPTQPQAQPQPPAPPSSGQPSAPTTSPAPENPWANYPTREVDRPILPAAKGYVMQIGFSSLSAQRFFNADGDPEKTVKPISIFHLDLSIHYGITDRWEAYAGLPYATASTSEFSTGATGNIYAGTRVSLYTKDRWELAAGLKVSAPTGDSQFHYHLENGHVVPENFRTGDPGFDFYPTFLAQYKANSNVRLHLQATAIFTTPGRTVLNQIGGKDSEEEVNPGDGFELDLGLEYQLSDKWDLAGGLQYLQLGETEFSGLDFNDRQELMFLSAGIMYQISPDFDLGLSTGFPMFGRNVYQAVPLGLAVQSRF